MTIKELYSVEESLKVKKPYFIGEVVTEWLHPTAEEIAAYEKLSFFGKLKANWSNRKNARKMKVVEDFAFVDSHGVKWEATAGTIVDGSSIPSFLWGVFGSPFIGRHRRASVLHDPECEKQTRPCEQVHQMYFDACRADGVFKTKAKLMHKGIKLRGPKW